jgi:hypothetical protein
MDETKTFKKGVGGSFAINNPINEEKRDAIKGPVRFVMIFVPPKH